MTARGRQVIPRPKLSRHGGPPPWDGVDEAAKRGISLQRVREAMRSRVSPNRGPSGPQPGRSRLAARTAAVLVALFEEDGEARVVLTRRAAHLRTHTGEVSFPGGGLDQGESAWQAAAREAREEIALVLDAAEYLGQLSELSTFSSGASITPVVASLPGRPDVKANPSEVERVFDVALADLLRDGVYREELWTIPERIISPGGPVRDDGAFPVWFFELADDTVWGATARILVELLQLVLVSRRKDLGFAGGGTL